ncbi:MAG: hypothetical protein ACE15F_15445 [bacterium]
MLFGCRGILYISAVIVLLSFFILPGGAQPLSAADDFDVLLIPIGAGVNPPGSDPHAPSLLERGWKALPVLDRPLPRHEAGPDRITVILQPGEAVQFVSNTIPVSSGSVYMSCRIAADGPKPGQTAMAVYDARNPKHLAVAIRSQPDWGPELRDFSLEFQRPGLQSVQWLIQLVGPESGETKVSLDCLRLLEDYSDQDQALGASRLVSVDGADWINEQPVIHVPPSTSGAYCRASSEVTPAHSSSPGRPTYCLGTRTMEDVIQVRLPLPPSADFQKIHSYPARIYAQARVRRTRGEEGVVSLALFSPGTQSGGYSDYPAASLPDDSWSLIEHPVQMAAAEMHDQMLILQVRGGPAEIELDEVSLHARRDAAPFWKADRISRRDDSVNR